MTEWDASAYQTISGLQQMVADRHLAHIEFDESECVLDVGCGNGRITAEIAARVPHGSVLGVDPSHNMIEFARKEYAAARPNLRFEVGDARSLPYQREFDTVVSFNALHWVPEQAAALRSIHTALKPDGRAVLHFVPEGERKCIEDVIEDTCRAPRWKEYFEGHKKPYLHFTPEAYRALAESNGFRVLDIQVQDNAWDFGSRDAFAAFCRVTLADWLDRLPESDWPAFINDVLDAYAIVAADKPSERNAFKFYQLEVTLALATATVLR
ncbi:MAG: class I SAM-dependent methyltransferase [Gammaproteobacteria bacterium]